MVLGTTDADDAERELDDDSMVVIRAAELDADGDTEEWRKKKVAEYRQKKMEEYVKK